MIRGAIALTATAAAVGGLIITGHHPHTRSAPAGSAKPAPTVSPTHASRAETRRPLPVVKRQAHRRQGTSRPRHSVPAAGSELDWSALAQCEASGNPRAVDPTGTYFGLYQFDILTWRSVGGRGNPADASRAEQTFRARILYGQRGRTPWPVCGVRL